jgi:murein L,D-transpeptidase YafK
MSAFKLVLLLCSLFLTHDIFAGQKVAFGDSPTEIVVDRSEQRLMIKKNGNVLRSFDAAFGSGGRKAKQKRGDRLTPTGVYKISEIRRSDRFHLFFEINYPNVRDAVRGLKSKLISKKQYNAILDAHIYRKRPPQNTPLGGQLGIHGIGNETKDKIEIHQIADWTQGCIALRNHEVEALLSYIDVGTTVTIQD